MKKIDLNTLPKITRQEALASKQTRYFASSCPKNHEGWRWTGSGNCIECIRIKNNKGKKRGKPFDPIRLLAKQNNEIYYFTGRPCKRGHLAKRRTATGSCQECHHNAYKSVSGDYTLRTKYGIKLIQYNEMFLKQNGKCAICNKKETAINKDTKKIRKLSVDHCHNTDKIRGLLCHNCNVGIGSLKHNPELLRKASLYCEVI